ncbi:MAG: alanine--tRNA ligase-related protein, partial [Candidatus Pacebacteria bacterium]|nr:alanine--tRNA ligase-related protein [Candidatus Paceibacterota bacterium]
MQAKEIREKYLKFFESKGHKIVPSASLIPENDPTVLFTTAGMHPLVPYLLGEKHPLGRRICNSQKCIRTGDIDDVGDQTHLTFFEMLGNWSLGDYFKREAIEWSFEFLTKELKIPLEKLAVSVFEGEAHNNIPRDEQAAEIWLNLGVPKERLAYLGREDNWWGPAGATGPCGPDTEMFYWAGEEPAPSAFDPGDKKWMEIWNDVFMQYNKTAEGKFEELEQKNVDTGMGLERVAAVLQEKSSVYETELFAPIIGNIKFQISDCKSKSKISNIEQERAVRIIADHIKAATFLLAEGLAPSNTERGYVLRRIIRRAVRYGKLLGIEKEFTEEVAK